MKIAMKGKKLESVVGITQTKPRITQTKPRIAETKPRIRVSSPFAEMFHANEQEVCYLSIRLL